MSLLNLANELLLSIAGNLTCLSNINAFARTNRQLYSLLNLGLYRYAVQTGNHSALHWAAFHGFSSIACMLLAEGASVKAATIRSKRTALHLASAGGHLLIVEALVQMGADVNAQSSTGTIPLHGAVSGGFADITQILLENGADYMKTLHSKNRPTVLHIASSRGDTAIVQLLLEKGMGIEVRDENLHTPLHCAMKFDEDDIVWYGNVETVAFLLERRANKEAWDKMGRRPKDLAVGHPSPIVELLFQNFNLDEAILSDERWQLRKEQEKAKKCKTEALAADGAANRMLRLKESSKLEKELRRELEEAEEEQDRAEREIFASVLRHEEQEAIRQGWAKMRIQAEEDKFYTDEKEVKKQQAVVREEGLPSVSRHKKADATGQAWAKMKAQAEGNIQRPNRTTKQSLCPHPSMGWLKCKRKGQCDECWTTCAKYSFICGDCSLVMCSACKAHESSKVNR